MKKTTTYKCTKCNGSGYLAHYAGIANGVCFSCAGAGVKVGKQNEKSFATGIRRALFAAWEEASAESLAAAKSDLSTYRHLGDFLRANGCNNFHAYAMRKFCERVSIISV